MTIIIKNNIIPFGRDYIAINLFGIIFSKVSLSEQNVRHEKTHTYQQIEMLYFGFFFWYILEWIIKIIMYRDFKKAYFNISFEREAYLNQNDENYNKHRKHYAWIKLI